MFDNASKSSGDDQYDVCIVGTGRVGLPLGLSLIESGLKVAGLDIDKGLINTINAGELPFAEPGYEKLIKSRAFQVTDNPEIVTRSGAIIITVGTPMHSHIEVDLGQIEQALKHIKEKLRPGHLICLRSTVAPGTTAFVKQWLEQKTSFKVGADLKLAFCPERIAEGHAYKELRTLPQIIGTEDSASRQAAANVLSRLTPEIIHTNFINAELLKLFTNIARYTHFATTNQFVFIADSFDADIYTIQRIANYKYPRTKIASPGMTAGSCLRKDFALVNELIPYADMLLSAWKINEYVPMFLVQNQAKRNPLCNKTVGVLGYTFKRDTDDTRDSLVPKLVRCIQRQLPKRVLVSDHYLPDPIPDIGNGTLKNWLVDEVCQNADCVFIATDHTGYREALERMAVTNPQASVVDIWNVGNLSKIFYQAKELVDKSAQDANAA